MAKMGPTMKIKVVIVVLAVACLALAIALFVRKNQAEEQHAADVNSINDFSNQLVHATDHLKDLGQVNLTLSNQVAETQQRLDLSGEQLAQLSNTLSAANAALAETKNSLASEEQLVTNLNSRITDLETQNKVLDQQADTLSNRLARLTTQIEDTKNQLAITETNAAFLQEELQKQLAQKAELEHKFNDIDELRAQVKKMKDEMWLARRTQLMKNDTGGKKGAELLITHLTPINSPPARKPAATNYDLNVEVGSDGTVKLLPPLGGTNGAAH